jgi:acetyl/propionyl-CoA carboxylase alpha subunit
MIRKILIANRGVSAMRILRTCRRLGIRAVAVYSDAEKDAPHVHLADEAVRLEASDGPPAQRLLEAARRIGADAVHPGCGSGAEYVDLAAACEFSGLCFIGPSSILLRGGLPAPDPAPGGAKSIALQPADPDARLIEFDVFGDQHGNAIHVLDRDTSIQKDGLRLVYESPAPSLGDDLRAQMADAAVTLARKIGYCNGATLRFLLTPAGAFRCLGGQPFLSVEHPVTEAATGLDLVQLQIEIAEGRRLPVEAPRACGHAIGATLYAREGLGTERGTRTFHVWDPPPASSTLRVEAGVAEGTQVPPFDPLLAQLIAVDAVREGAIRQLSQALEALWVGGVPTNQLFLLHVLQSQQFRDGKVHLGFLDQYPLDVRADEAADMLFAAAGGLYLETSRHAQRNLLPGVPPNYRNNPYRDPSMTLRIGTRDLALCWRRLGPNHYKIQSANTELDAEVLALGDFRPGTLSLVLDGILRKFRFREVADELFVHSPLGSRVIQRLSRYPRREAAPAVQPPPVPRRRKFVAPSPPAPAAPSESKPPGRGSGGT